MSLVCYAVFSLKSGFKLVFPPKKLVQGLDRQGKTNMLLYIFQSYPKQPLVLPTHTFPWQLTQLSVLSFPQHRQLLLKLICRKKSLTVLHSCLYQAIEQRTVYHKQLLAQMEMYDARIKSIFDRLLSSYNYVLETGRNYDSAFNSLVTFANSMRIVLQYATYEEFKDAIIHQMPFILE